MRCLVLLSVLMVCAGVARAAAAGGSCGVAEEFFVRHNVSADDSNIPGPTCSGHCCGRGREASLRSELRRRVGARAALSTRPIAELLLSTKRNLEGHLTELSHQSQNKTAIFFTQIYKGHATRAHGPLSALYEDIRLVLRASSEKGPTSGEDFGSPPPKDLEESAKKFFRNVFPVVYHNVLRLEGSQFTLEYEACLRDAYDAAQPFGEVPIKFGTSLSRSLEAARALLQVLALGAGTLAASEQILANAHNDVCSTALLRAGGCGFCRGYGARPCRNYCLNVARGCIGSLVSELDAPWAGYVEGVERLARVNDADATLRSLDTKVSEAIMYALESQVVLIKKVRQECGAPSTKEEPPSSYPHVTTSTSRRDALRAPPPDTELLQFAASLATSKKLFAGVADKLCDELDFADEGNEACWNGDAVGSYTKALAPSTSVSDQRYNPEVETSGTSENPQVATLGDRLRQARQLLISHTSMGGGMPAAESFMQGDEAGEEGSGSGRSYDDDGSYDAEGSGFEGSGYDTPETTGIKNTPTTEPKTGAATTSQPFIFALSLSLLATFSQYRT